MFAPDLYVRSSITQPNQYQAAIDKSTFNGQYTSASVIVTLSLALGYYNSLEMILLVSTTFKKWRGLYFWSLNLCTAGVILYSLGMMLMYFELCILWLSKVILDVGWVFMIFFQSLVLYSRLNLVLEHALLLKVLKWYILIDSAVLFIPVIILDFGSTYSANTKFARAYYYVEPIQLIAFSVQEVTLSLVYVWKAIQLLQVLSKTRVRSMMWQLITVNLVIIGMDIVLIIFEFKHLQLYQESVKGFVYSVKLKLELNILSRLVDLVHGPKSAERRMTMGGIDDYTIDSNTIIGQAQDDIRQEMIEPDTQVNWLGTNDNGISRRKKSQGSPSSWDSPAVEPSLGPFLSTAPVDDAVISMPSQSSHGAGHSARMNGRETDMMYANALRSMSMSQ